VVYGVIKTALEVQVRGGSGAAERLHTSVRHLAAAEEVERGKHRQAA
jgi:hypothetical protein